MEPKLIASGPARLEDALDDLHYALNGPIKTHLQAWHDILYKVHVAKMGYITLTPQDVKAFNEALTPLRQSLLVVNTMISDRMK